MAKIKVSELPTTTALASGGSDVMMILQGGSNKKITVANVFNTIETNFTMKGSSKFDVKYSNNTDSLLVVDPATSKVGVGIDAPEALLHVNGNLKIGGTAGPIGSPTSILGGHLLLSNETITVASGEGTASNATKDLTNDYMVTKLNLATGAGSNGTVYVLLPAPSNTMLRIITIGSNANNYKCSLEFNSNVLLGTNRILLEKTGSSVVLLGIGGTWSVLGAGYPVNITPTT